MQYSLPLDQNEISLRQACDHFLKDIEGWMQRVMGEFPEGIESDSHDSGTFMTPWATVISRSDNRGYLDYLKQHRDKTAATFTKDKAWIDGYWTKQEAHHGPEHFQIFLYTLYKLDRRDKTTTAQLADGAEHIGNWKPGFPKWYDYENHLFNSLYLGTGVVGEFSLNVPDHFRFCDLCLKTYECTKDGRYLDFAVNYLTPWAEAIVNSGHLPLGFDREGPVFDRAALERSSYKKFVGQGAASFEDDLRRAEMYMASGCHSVFLNIWKIRGNKIFLRAAEKLIDTLMPCLRDGMAWQVHGALREYRDMTKSDRYDGDIRSLTPFELRPVETLRMSLEQKSADWAVGTRSDKPDWYDENGEYAPSPLLQSLYAEVTGDSRLMAQAVRMGHGYFELAGRAFGDVNAHGCTSRALHAIGRGHGRLNGCGVITQTLEPAMQFLERD